MVFLGIGLVFTLGTSAFGQMDATGLKANFSPLVDAEAQAASLAAQIENLGADSYKLQRAAQKALSEMPFSPRGPIACICG